LPAIIINTFSPLKQIKTSFQVWWVEWAGGDNMQIGDDTEEAAKGDDGIFVNSQNILQLTRSI
jgi:hypothetical protein